MQTKRSKYAAIWNLLKEKHYCLIACNNDTKETIRKAIIKRKDTDKVFKQSRMRDWRLDINIKKDSLIEFRLVPPISKLTVEDI